MLKIGIFQCDHVHETLVTIYGEYTDMIEKAFANYIESEQMQSLQFIRYAVIDNEFPDDDKECDSDTHNHPRCRFQSLSRMSEQGVT